jgi:hypothetical protein
MLLSAKVKVAIVGLVVAGGALTAAALGPAGLAVGQSSPPTVGQSSSPVQANVAVDSPARLVARGAGVDVTVTVTCSSPLPTSGNVSISLTENVGNYQATGGPMQASFDCTGAAQNVEVLVVANPGGKAFVKGTVTAQVSMSACEVINAASVGACASTGAEQTIRIRE